MDTLDIMREGERIAWTATWIIDEYEGHHLVAIPRLRLSHELALVLSSHTPYPKAFAKATVVVGGRLPREFVVVHSALTIFKTGEPDIENFAVLVPELALPLPPPGNVITRTAQMLRGER